MRHIIEHLEATARGNPDQMFSTFLDGSGAIIDSLTYRELHQRSNHVAASLRASGKIGFSDTVVLVYAPGLDFIVAFLACVKLGAVPVPVPPPESSGLAGGIERLFHVARDCNARIALTHEPYLKQLRTLADRGVQAAISLIQTPPGGLAWLPTDHVRGELPDFESRVNPTLFLQYTSGSTQSPRGVVVSHENVIHNCEATLTHRPIAVSWLPHYHDMGLIGYYLYIMLKAGCVYTFSGANFLRRPLLWLETITRVRATITSAPNFAFEYCLREDKVPTRALDELDLSSLHQLMNASEPVRSSTHERFMEKFSRCGLSTKALVVFYGLAENTLAATGNGRVHLTVNSNQIERGHVRIERPTREGYNQKRLMSCGRPLTGVEVRIVDSNSFVAVGDDRVGEIWIAGRSKAQGYFNKPAINASLFSAAIQSDDTVTPYLRTGDLGFMHDGELYICGRLKDMIIVGGRNYYPNDIEAVIERSSSKIRPACVAAFAIEGAGGAEAIAVLAEVTKANDIPDLEQILQEIRRYCQVEVTLIAIVAHGTIAKTSSGKVARQECARRFNAGEVTVLASMRQEPQSSDDAFLTNIVTRFDHPDLQDRTLAELGVDSLTLVELSLCIENRLKAASDLARYKQEGQWLESIFDLRILQTITVRELLSALRGFSGKNLSSKLISNQYARRLGAVEKQEFKRMQQDAVLPADVVLQARPPRNDGKLLLTGATGFLGSFLLAALLRLTDREIVTIARAQDDEHAKARVRVALQRNGLLDAASLVALRARVSAFAGNVAAPELGLSPRQFDALAHDVSTVYHCAAEVDYVKPYDSLRESNVAGTLEAIRFSARGASKALHLVSTTFIFGFTPRSVCWEDECNAEMSGLTFGYPQSKWVAEQLVFEATRRGLAARVYRPSFVTASRSGHYVRRDLMARTFAYMIRHGISTDAINQMSFIPVDVCANNLVALSLLPEMISPVVHLTADDYYTMQDTCSLISREFGYVFEYLSLQRAVDHMNQHCTKNDPLYPLIAFFNNNHRRIEGMRDKRYDNKHYRKARAQSPLALPEPPLHETIGSLVSFLQHESLIPAPRRGTSAGAPAIALRIAASAS